MKKYAFALLLFIAIAFTAKAQTINVCTDPQATGIVRIIADPALQQIIFPNEVIATDNNIMTGFRIQVYSGTNRTEAEHIKQEISQNYGNVPVYEVYQSPYFKIRVGDFRNRIEAQELFYKLKQQYTGILLAPDKIEFPQLY
jgi:hypothetical protein